MPNLKASDDYERSSGDHWGRVYHNWLEPPGLGEKDRKWEGELQAGFKPCGPNPNFPFWNEVPD